MNKAIKILAVLLVAQLVVILAIQTNQPGTAQVVAQPLISVNLNTVDTLRIDGSDGQHVALTKRGERWQIASYGDQPADQNKVAELLQKLSGIEVRWPVATSAAAAERFEVAEGSAQKTLTIQTGDSVVDALFIGTSPSYRRVHVRVNGSDDIYQVELAQHDIPADPESWMDKTVLQFEGDILSVKAGDIAISRDTNGDETAWKLAGSAADSTDPALINRWVKRFNSLVVNALVPAQNVEPIIVQNPALTVHISGEKGDADYAFYAADEKYYIKRFGSSALYEIASYQAKPIVEVEPKKFMINTSDAEPAQ
ncbi:DUF4340 domain-containing protein [Teredinibacter turnerae]|uniref:DUF4340 domain-containing protein n=1 Tax=Teredinibacter turnerae TaxID=2426 RepID=UPI00037DEBC8|nr:DUF4340 domain-containing protein [Teredinibacter turnerae]